MANFIPADSYSDLTDEHLIAIARILRDVRSETIQLHDPLAGDGQWSLGCRIYERSMNRIRDASARLDWLSIIPEASHLRLTFAIGAVSMRFYTGSSEDPPPRYTFTTFGELRQQQLLLDMGNAPSLDAVLRMAIEPGNSSESALVTLVEMDLDGNVRNTYVVPIEAASENVFPIIAPPVELPPPSVQPRETAEEKEKREWEERNEGEKQG